MRLLLATVSLFQLSIISLYQCVQIKTMTHLNDIPFYFQFGDFLTSGLTLWRHQPYPRDPWLICVSINTTSGLGLFPVFHFRFTPMTSSTLSTWSLTHLRLNKHNFRFGIISCFFTSGLLLWRHQPYPRDSWLICVSINTTSGLGHVVWILAPDWLAPIPPCSTTVHDCSVS